MSFKPKWIQRKHKCAIVEWILMEDLDFEK
jgi:hypothetical protein